MVPRDESPASDEWRVRYLDLLQELEHKEQEWQRLDRRFRQAVARLTHLPDDPALQQPLSELRHAVRDGRDEALESLLDDLATAVQRADAASHELGPGPAPPEPELTRQLLSLLTRRLLPVEASGDLRAALEEADTPERMRKCAQELVRLTASPGLAPGEVLLQLIERLSFPPELESDVEKVKARLVQGVRPDTVAAAVDDVADLVARIRSRVQDEKRELELFLRSLTENLQTLDKELHAALALQQESASEGRALNAALTSEVESIEKSVADSADLDRLKSAVEARMQAIRAHMERFRSADQQRADQAEGQVRRLTSKMGSLEQEVRELRHQVEEERQQALLDSLTGIPNRLAYEERLNHEIARRRRYDTPLSLILCDVDRFKDINDRFGHLAGDKVLRVIAKLLRSRVRSVDFIARYGGEEFVMLLPDTDANGAMQVAEQLRSAVEAAEFHHRGERVQVTISSGIAQFRSGDEPEAVLARADRALYEAKGAGRNRTRIADPSA